MVRVRTRPSGELAPVSAPGRAGVSALPGGSSAETRAAGSVLAPFSCSAVGCWSGRVSTLKAPSSATGACSTVRPGESAVTKASAPPTTRSTRSAGVS